MNESKIFFGTLALCILLTECKQSLEWESGIGNSGTFSSPRAIDLNNDGIKDIVIGGGGKREWEASENGVVAINGKDGTTLWKTPCRNQMIGSALFKDINEDGIPDVIIGGRSAQLMVLDGRNGKVIWEYFSPPVDAELRTDTTILNFFDSQLISDQDNDNMEDILVAYGGYVEALSMDHDRPCGYLMLFSSKSGKILAKAAMPDGKETYMSPVVWEVNQEELIVFGTGGETIPGNLYVTNLKDILDGEISEHDTLLTGTSKGFIAPPVLVQLTDDIIPDLVVNAYQGETYALDGKSHEVLWSVIAGQDYETHSQPAVGDFVGDRTPDFFVNYGKGTWPEIIGALQVVINGSSGAFYSVDSVGYLQYSSPIPVKVNNEGKERIMLAINDKIPTNYAPELGYPSYSYQNTLYLFDMKKREKNNVVTFSGTNTGSTVFIDDLDGDGASELIYAYNTNPYDPFRHNGFRVLCQPFKGYPSTWNQYMGKGGRSYFKPDYSLLIY